MDKHVAALVDAGVSGDAYPNTGLEFVVFDNYAASGTITVTADIAATLDGQAAVNPTFPVVHGKIVMVGPYPPTVYSDGNSRVNFTYSGNDSFKVGVFKPTTT